jgi:hypothetical protein
MLLFACNKDEIKIDSDNLLLGIWTYSEYQNDAAVYTRSDGFTDNPCYKFKSDGSLLERKNSGFCGTPPITYSDYDGSWSVINDTIIEIKSAYWGGEMTYSLDIESVTMDTLKVKTLLEIR